MGRKTADITIAEDNRDVGKTFHLTEMAAIPATKWATKVLFAIAQSGVDLSPEILAGGMASMAFLGIQALLHVNYEVAEPLLAELLTCVQVKEPAVIRPLTPNDIEEVSTVFKLYGEVLQMHTGFSLAGALSKSSAPAPTSTSSTTPMSIQPSAQQ